jgi:hypothetical protein
MGGPKVACLYRPRITCQNRRHCSYGLSATSHRHLGIRSRRRGRCGQADLDRKAACISSRSEIGRCTNTPSVRSAIAFYGVMSWKSLSRPANVGTRFISTARRLLFPNLASLRPPTTYAPLVIDAHSGSIYASRVYFTEYETPQHASTPPVLER